MIKYTPRHNVKTIGSFIPQQGTQPWSSSLLSFRWRNKHGITVERCDSNEKEKNWFFSIPEDHLVWFPVQHQKLDARTGSHLHEGGGWNSKDGPWIQINTTHFHILLAYFQHFQRICNGVAVPPTIRYNIYLFGILPIRCRNQPKLGLHSTSPHHPHRSPSKSYCPFRKIRLCSTRGSILLDSFCLYIHHQSLLQKQLRLHHSLRYQYFLVILCQGRCQKVQRQTG